LAQTGLVLRKQDTAKRFPLESQSDQ